MKVYSKVTENVSKDQQTVPKNLNHDSSLEKKMKSFSSYTLSVWTF